MMPAPHCCQIKFILVSLASGTKLTKNQSYTEAHFYIFTVDIFVIYDRTVDELVLVPLQWQWCCIEIATLLKLTTSIILQRWAIPYVFNDTDTDTSIGACSSAIPILVSIIKNHRYQYQDLVSEAKVLVNDTGTIRYQYYWFSMNPTQPTKMKMTSKLNVYF